MTNDLDSRAINTIRTLSIDAIQKANSGHPGLPLGAAPMAFALWQRHLRHNPKNTQWADRDRFILSAGHGSMLLYSLLHLYGYDVSLDDLKNFRQWGSNTPGHPESFMTAGVEATTGPLGQGIANAVGMAIAERYLGQYFNREGHTIVDHHTYAICGDGDLMEGVAMEAACLAGHLGLNKLIVLYDSNDISLDGPTNLSFRRDLASHMESFGWRVLRITERDASVDAIDEAIAEAKTTSDRPVLIEVKTTIGYGSPNKQGTSGVHGSPLGASELALTKESLGWHEGDFAVPADVADHCAARVTETAAMNASWDQDFAAYERAYPDLAAAWKQAQAGELPEGWDADLPNFEVGKSVATRAASGKILNAIAAKVPWFLGGDADLSCSTKTAISGGGSMTHEASSVGAAPARNIHYGVREHAMGAIANGIAYHGGLHNYTATFLCFADYMRPAMRLAALSELPVTFIFTHDSIGLGEDGPTHQPVEHVASLRVIPNMRVFRPADATESAEAWRYAMTRRTGPTTLVFSRQDLPVLDRAKLAPASGVQKGGYLLSPAQGEAKVILIATGSEVALALASQEALQAEGIATAVVSMPCWNLFFEQDKAYRDQVLPPGVRARVAIEAGVSFGWERVVGDGGAVIGVDRFGASAPAETIFENYGFTVANVCKTAKGLLG